jgi:hypothetical protein
MEKSLIIISIIVLVLFTTPILLFSMRKSKKTNHLVKKFKSFSVTQNLNLSELDVWEDRGIGIDRDSQFIFFAKGREFDELVEKVDLQKVKRCEVNKNSRNVGSIYVVDRVDLRIIFKETNAPHLLLEFYNVQGRGQIYNEFQLAEKWGKIINDSVIN